MGAHTRPAREGKCKYAARLISGTYLYCDREEEHEGTHRDDTEGMWWLPSARLEVIRIGCNLCGEKLPDGEPHVCVVAS